MTSSCPMAAPSSIRSVDRAPALVGMRVWSDRLGYFAAVGSDIVRIIVSSSSGSVSTCAVSSSESTTRPPAPGSCLKRRRGGSRSSAPTSSPSTGTGSVRGDASDYFDAQGFHLHFGHSRETAELAEKLRAVIPPPASSGSRRNSSSREPAMSSVPCFPESTSYHPILTRRAR